MGRGFGIDAYEPLTGKYRRQDASNNEAHLHLRDALEVYSQLSDRSIDTALAVDIEDGEATIQRMEVDGEVLNGTVERRYAISLEYELTFTPPHDRDQDALLAEYAGLHDLLRMPEKVGPADLLPEADIALAEEDLAAMLEDGTITAAELYDTAERRLPEAYTRLDDLQGVDLDDTDPWFPPTLAATEEDWTFRTALHDRSREHDTVTYTVELEAKRMQDDGTETQHEPDGERGKDGLWPFSGRGDASEAGGRNARFDTFEPVGSVTFTIPRDSETLEHTAADDPVTP